MSKLIKTKANLPGRSKAKPKRKSPPNKGGSRPKVKPKRAKNRKKIGTPAASLSENEIRLRKLDLDRLKREMVIAKISIPLLFKMNISPMLLLLMALMKGVAKVVPGRVLLSAPFVTPVEAQRVLEELGFIPEGSATHKTRIIQGLRLLHAEGYIEHSPMENEGRAKPYKATVNGKLDKFFE